MKNMNDDSLSTTDDFILIFNVRQLYLGMSFSQFRSVNVEPLIFCFVYVFSLFVWDKDVFKYQADYLCWTSNGPVDYRYLVFLGDVKFLCQSLQPLLFCLMWFKIFFFVEHFLFLGTEESTIFVETIEKSFFEIDIWGVALVMIVVIEAHSHHTWPESVESSS